MNYKAATKYQIGEFKKSVTVFYIVVFSVMVFFLLAVYFSKSSSFQSDFGLEMSTMIFLFVAGLNCFKETFLMMMQNGISRRTMFVSRIVSMLAISSIMALIDRIIIILFGKFEGASLRYNIYGLFEQTYDKHAEELGFFQKQAEGFFLTFFIFLAGIALGYFITAAYYRMNKTIKLVVSVGTPVGFFVVLPLIDYSLTKGKVSETLYKFARFVFGADEGTPYHLMLSSVVAFVLLLGLSWLLIRKATDKN